MRIAAAELGGDIEGVLRLEPMVTTATETLIGLTQDSMFGPLVAFGFGGTQVAVQGRGVPPFAPLTIGTPDEMIRRGVRGSALLQGYRNKPRADVDALRDVLLKVSSLGANIPELAELKLDP